MATFREELGQAFMQTPFVKAGLLGLTGSEVANKILSEMSPKEKAQLATSMVPYLGTTTSVGVDSYDFYKDPGLGTGATLGLNALPFNKIVRYLRSVGVETASQFSNILSEMAKQTAESGLGNTPNFIRAFYGKGPGGMFGLGEAAVKGLTNEAVTRVSPRAIAARRQGVTQAMTNRAKLSLKEFDTATKELPIIEEKIKAANDLGNYGQVRALQKRKEKLTENKQSALKKVMGAVNAQQLYNEQYGRGLSKLGEKVEGLAIRKFTDFKPQDYFDSVREAGGNMVPAISRSDTDVAFREISSAWNVNPDKKYRLALRNPSAGASGKLIDPIRKNRKILGGVNRRQLAEVFSEGGFNSNKELLEALQKVPNIKIRNVEGVLKNNESPVLMGSFKSDAVDLGGVNVVTTVKPEGKMFVIVSDENDLLNIPKVNKSLKAPLADSRMISVTTPVEFDLLKIAKKEKGENVEVSIPSDAKTREAVAESLETASGRKLGGGAGSATRADLAVTEYIADLKPEESVGDLIEAGAGVADIFKKPLTFSGDDDE
jgi:hypothetical protein